MPYRAPPQTRLHVAARTDVGRCRAENEDTFRVGLIGSRDVLAPVPASAQSHEVSARLAALGYVLGVYDGCGGWEEDSGSVASATAAEVVQAELCGGTAPAAGDLSDWLAATVEEAGRRIWSLRAEDPDHWGMGTTATVAVLVGPTLEVAQVGDSRAYLLDGASLRQLTRDDTLVNEYLAMGQLPPDAAASIPRNVITKALGVRERTVPTLTSVEVRAGDRLLLCTDGVSGPIDDTELERLLRRHREPDACCRAIVEAVFRAGAPDNLTMIVADVCP